MQFKFYISIALQEAMNRKRQMERSMHQMERSMEDMRMENMKSVNIGPEMDQEVET